MEIIINSLVTMQVSHTANPFGIILKTCVKQNKEVCHLKLYKL